MLGLVQAGYESCSGKVALFGKSLAVSLFSSSPTPIFVLIPSPLFMAF